MKILAPAKINLFLEIKNKRSDGYHNLESIFQTVSLYDTITIKKSNSANSLECDTPGIPNNDKNLALRAANVLKEHLNIKSGVKILLKKNIPAGAGLGGGSSDAAAVLKGLLSFWGKDISYEQLLKIAASLGADVPFFLHGGSALVSGIGEKIEEIEGNGTKKPQWLLLVYPRMAVSTAWVYKNLRFPLTKKQKITKIYGQLTSNLSSYNWNGLLFNRLEDVVLPKYPEISKIKTVFSENGITNLMSGSGASVFGLLSSKKAAEKVRLKFSKYPWDTWVVRFVS